MLTDPPSKIHLYIYFDPPLEILDPHLHNRAGTFANNTYSLKFQGLKFLWNDQFSSFVDSRSTDFKAKIFVDTLKSTKSTKISPLKFFGYTVYIYIIIKVILYSYV